MLPEWWRRRSGQGAKHVSCEPKTVERRRASDDGAQCAHKPVEQQGAPEPSELEGEWMSAADLGLELHFVKRRREPLHARDGGIPKGNTGFLTTHQDPLDPETTPDDAEKCHRQHRLRLLRKCAEAVAQLGPERLDVPRRLEAREPLVDVELGLLGLDVVVREVG